MATPFTDDFNSYNNGDLNGQGGWSGSADFDVQGTTVYEGAKAVNATPSSPVQTISKTGTGVSDGKVSFYVRMTATNKDCVYKWKDGATDVIWFRVRDNGYFSRIYNVSSWQNIKTYSANTWYLIEIEWRSSDHYARYRITVAGNTPGSWDVDWESPASTSWSSIDTLTIAAESGTHYIDHIAEEPYSPVANYSETITDVLTMNTATTPASKFHQTLTDVITTVATATPLTKFHQILSSKLTLSTLTTAANIFCINITDTLRLNTITSTIRKGWNWITKHTTSWTQDTKHTTSWTQGTKHTTNWTFKDKS